jgi:carbamoyl-phosphate synthase small subunit
MSLASLLRNARPCTRSLSRCYATVQPQLVASDGQPAALHLKTGQVFKGTSFGAPRSAFGETVFSTSITSYPESMTDPSYLAQILVFTTPMIGNYGIPNNDLSAGEASNGPAVFLESNGIKCAGVVVADVADRYSHYQAMESLSQWCVRHNVPGITGVDTRAITSLLRQQGTTLGKLAVGPHAEKAVTASEYWDPAKENLVAQASTKEPYTLNPGGDVKIALLDFGAKANIIRSLVKRNAAVTVLPWNYDFNAVRDQYDGLFLSNGPGDPAHCMEAVHIVRKTLDEWRKPIFGICMGNQILGLAANLETYRMTFGNRGHNQPVLALASSGSIVAGRVYITSQNRGFDVAQATFVDAFADQYALKLVDPFPKGWEPWFINANVGLCEVGSAQADWCRRTRALRASRARKKAASSSGLPSSIPSESRACARAGSAYKRPSDPLAVLLTPCESLCISARVQLTRVTRTLFDDYVGVCRAIAKSPNSASPSAIFHEPVHKLHRGRTIAVAS